MKKVLVVALFLVLVILPLVSCGGYDAKYPMPENPYDDVYETTVYSENTSFVLTSRSCPYIYGNALVITNYWEQQWDEEGNEEWVHYDNDFYRLILPLNKISVEILRTCV
jgi:hypothetical protein